MKRKQIFIVSLALVAALISGIFVGVQVEAFSNTPGTESDPLVSKSYLDQQLEERVQELEEELARVQARANELERILGQ
ncbi:hypothetical protein GGQ84_000677 [Desulfitispora alkaliphila]|uniref:hypothetical protein n=1 Tax=Desulfitispora alkaliphila TaxID=622674 RepID=UPI003D2271B4